MTFLRNNRILFLIFACTSLITLDFEAHAAKGVADSVKIMLTEGTNLAIALSPDKKTIAMDLQGTIFTTPVSGGAAKAITDELGDCRQPVWSADGSKITFQSFWDGNFHIYSVECGLIQSIFVTTPSSLTGRFASNSAANEWCANAGKAATVRSMAPATALNSFLRIAIVSMIA
jgi:Tol biopolymer transport system component